MDRVQNQKAIKIVYHAINKGDIYMRLHKDALYSALSIIKTEGAIKVYMYLAAQASTNGNYSWILSRSEILRVCNISEKTYKKAVNTLIELGYLVQDENTKNNYAFYQYPQLDNKDHGKERVEPQKEELIDFTDSGESIPQWDKKYPTGGVKSIPPEGLKVSQKDNKDNNTDNKENNNLAATPHGEMEKGEERKAELIAAEPIEKTEIKAAYDTAALYKEKKANQLSLEDIEQCTDREQLKEWFRNGVSISLSNAIHAKLYN